VLVELVKIYTNSESVGLNTSVLRFQEGKNFWNGPSRYQNRLQIRKNRANFHWDLKVMKVHADRKAILEVEFTDEEGTGLGPTLEFFALVSFFSQ